MRVCLLVIDSASYRLSKWYGDVSSETLTMLQAINGKSLQRQFGPQVDAWLDGQDNISTPEGLHQCQEWGGLKKVSLNEQVPADQTMVFWYD